MSVAGATTSGASSSETRNTDFMRVISEIFSVIEMEGECVSYCAPPCNRRVIQSTLYNKTILNKNSRRTLPLWSREVNVLVWVYKGLRVWYVASNLFI